MIVGVPSGIGDVSWLYSKLKHAKPMTWEVAKGWPHRTVPFLQLLDNIVDARYGDFEYPDIVSCKQLVKERWFDTISNGVGRVLIECNLHLEQGNRLEDWMPDLPCDFHYEIRTEDKDQKRAEELLAGLEKPLWGVSAASYRGSEAWNTWGLEQWLEFLRPFQMHNGGTIILLGGFWDDLTAAIAGEGFKDLVGKTSVGCMVEVLRRLTGYIGFSSGIGVLRTVLGLPVFMMWPDHQRALSTSWAPKEMLKDGSYVAMPWVAPSHVLRRCNSWVREMVTR